MVVLGLLVLAAADCRSPPARFWWRPLLFCTATPTAPSLPSGAAAATYAAGFALATALLHAIGIGVARMACSDSGRLLVRGAGALVAAAGVALALV